MDISDVKFSFNAVQWLVTAAIGIYAWFVGRQAASAKELLELRTRLIQIEAAMKQVPSQTTMMEVLKRLERVDTELRGLGRELKPINSNLDRINTYLLNHK